MDAAGDEREPSGADERAAEVAPPTRERALDLLRRAERIFIAYSHSDLRRARAFRRAIVRLRPGRDPASVFLDQESLPPAGSVSPHDVDRRLHDSDLFVVLCGADTADRLHVNREIDEAMRLRESRGLTVLPVILQAGVRLPQALDFRVQGVFLTVLFPEVARRRRALRLSLALLVALLVVASVLALRSRARQQASAREATSQRLSAHAREMLHADPQRAVVLAVEAVKATDVDGRVLAPARQALREALSISYGYGLGSHEGAVRALAFTPDGRWLVTASADGTARLWDVTAHDPARPPVVLRGHAGPLTGLALDRSGSLLVTGSDDGTVRVWKLAEPDPSASQTVLRSEEPIDGKGISRVAVSPDGRRVVASRGTRVWLWELGGGDATLPRFELSHSQEVDLLALSPDGRWLATEDCDPILWELEATDPTRTRRRLETPSETPSMCAKSLAFSPDARWLVTGSQDNLARLFDLTRADPADAPLVVEGYVAGLASFSGIDLVAVPPGDRWLLTGYGDGTVQMWDWREKTKVEPGPLLQGHEWPVENVVSGEQGLWLATRAADGTLRLWDPGAEFPERSGALLRGHVGVSAVAFGPERWLATGALDGTVRLARLPLAPQRGGAYARSGARTAISPESRWVATSRSDGRIWLWDLSADEPTETPIVLPGHSKPVNALEISADGRWLATASYDRTSLLHDLRAQDVASSATPIRGQGEEIRDLVFTGDGRWIVAAGSDGSVLLRDLSRASGAASRTIRHAPEGDVRVLASADGRWLVTGGARAPVRVWDLAAEPPAERAALGEEQALLWPSTISADGRWLVLFSEGCRALLWDLSSVDPARAPLELRACDGDSFAHDTSDDGRLYATGGEDGAVRLWDLTAADPSAQPRSLGRHAGAVSRVVFAPGGRRLFSADVLGVVHSFDLAARDVEGSVTKLRGHESAVTALTVTSDLRWLVTGDQGGVVRLWDLRAEDVAASVGTLPSHDAEVIWVTSSRDSRWALSLGSDTSVKLSSLSLDWMLRRARRAAGRNLRPDEWTQYFPGEPYRPTFADVEAARRGREPD